MSQAQGRRSAAFLLLFLPKHPQESVKNRNLPGVCLWIFIEVTLGAGKCQCLSACSKAGSCCSCCTSQMWILPSWGVGSAGRLCAQVPWGGWHSSHLPQLPLGVGLWHFAELHLRKSPSFDPKQHRSGVSEGWSKLQLCRALPWLEQGWIWDQGTVPRVFHWHTSVSLYAELVFLFLNPLLPLVTLGMFLAFTQHPQLLVLGVLRLMSDLEGEDWVDLLVHPGEGSPLLFQTKTALQFSGIWV